MSALSEFMGRDGFTWFIGVIEDRNDPEKLGRVRVRALGYHTEDKTILPTADLPWAAPLLPITSSGVSGIGQTPLGLIEGSWVVGFYRDAGKLQDAIILGSLTGKPNKTGADNYKSGLGFSDPNGIYPRYKDESDVNKLARAGADATLTQFRQTQRISVIPTANISEHVKANEGTTTASIGDTWDQPKPINNATYPFNHVFESEGGHVKEFDDTTDNKRILEYHASGTESEVTNDGTKTDVVKGKHYQINSKDKQVYIQGNSDVTLDGRHKILINAKGLTDNNYDIQIGPNANINIQVDSGDVNITAVEGNMNLFANNDLNMNVGGTYTLKAGKIVESSTSTTTRTAQQEYHTYGNPIDHN